MSDLPSADELKNRITQQLTSPGQTYNFRLERPASCYLAVTFRKLDAASAEELKKKNKPLDQHKIGTRSYDGSGKSCPLCGGNWIQTAQYSSSDGFCGVERGAWVCAGACCLEKMEDSETYNSIFWD